MRIRLNIVILSLILACTAYPYASSTSYVIPADVMASTGGPASSSTYGYYGILSGINLGSGSSASYAMREGFLPLAFQWLAVILTSISPPSGYNTGTIDITDIAGSGFVPGATVKLSLTGETDINATEVVVDSSTKITCRFDLTGKTTGQWDVTVTNPDGLTATLPRAFEIKTWATLEQLVNYPNPFDPTSGPTTLIYKLAADTDVILVIFNITHELIYKQTFTAGMPGGRFGDNRVTWNGYSNFGAMVPNGLYLCRLVNKNTGQVISKGKIAVSR